MTGVVIINKPKGITSNDVVQKIRKILEIRQVGHCGTLDPLATGVLPILVGQATKISKYMIEHDKTYIATIKLGKKTTTGDSEGEIIQSAEAIDIDENSINNVLKLFIGKSLQTPPIFSAIKVNGKKLYEYARENQNVKLEPRMIEIYNLTLLNYNKELQEIKYEVSCSKGTYIRTLSEDIAEKLGTVRLYERID